MVVLNTQVARAEVGAACTAGRPVNPVTMVRYHDDRRRQPKAGLEDTVATSSAICYLDGDRGVLAYCGYDIHDLARHATFEEVCYPALASAAADSRRARRSAVAAGGGARAARAGDAADALAAG